MTAGELNILFLTHENPVVSLQCGLVLHFDEATDEKIARGKTNSLRCSINHTDVIILTWKNNVQWEQYRTTHHTTSAHSGFEEPMCGR